MAFILELLVPGNCDIFPLSNFLMVEFHLSLVSCTIHCMTKPSRADDTTANTSVVK